MRFSLCHESRIHRPGPRKARAGYSVADDALLLVLAEAEGDAVPADMTAMIALQAMGARFQQAGKSGALPAEAFLREGFLHARQEIGRYHSRQPLAQAPRLSLLACLVRQGDACWARCGTARLLWLRDGRILARTRVPRENAGDGGQGASAWPEPDVSRRAQLQEGDVMLLASSGMAGMLTDHRIAHGLRRGPVTRTIPALLDAAVGTDGKNSDNVTALALRWGDSREPAVAAPPSAQAMLRQPARHADLTSDVFNETEIEKAIEEIRGAIARSSR